MLLKIDKSLNLFKLTSKLKVRQVRNDFFKPTFLPKNEWTNSTLILVDLSSFVFLKKVKTQKRHFKIKWQLGDLLKKLWPSQNIWTLLRRAADGLQRGCYFTQVHREFLMLRKISRPKIANSLALFKKVYTSCLVGLPLGSSMAAKVVFCQETKFSDIHPQVFYLSRSPTIRCLL